MIMWTKKKRRYSCKSTSAYKAQDVLYLETETEELAKGIVRFLLVLSEQLSTVPNNLVPKASWVLREGAPYASSDVCFRAAEGTPPTSDLRQLSLQSLPLLPSSACHPDCKLLGWHKENQTGNKTYIQPSPGIIRGTHREVRDTSQEFSSYLDLEWLSNSQVCSFDNIEWETTKKFFFIKHICKVPGTNK